MITKILFIIAISLLVQNSGRAENRFIGVASTTSTQNSGLFSAILPIFEKKSGIEVRVVAVGTGHAIRIAKNGDADVLFVHHKPSELDFVAKGFGVQRLEVMYNDFIVVGPKSDPAGVQSVNVVIKAFNKIASFRSNFVSRGDDSGTHKRERLIWDLASIDVVNYSGKWYHEIGAGMGATLNFASAKNAYTISDRGTWLSFNNKGSLSVLLEGGKELLNHYGVILVNPAKHGHVKAKEGQIFIDWLVSRDGQESIKDFKVNGKQLFFPSIYQNH